MTTTKQAGIRRRYTEFRKHGFNAQESLRSARIEETFDILESKGFVRIVNPADCDPDLSFLDDWTDTRGDRASAKSIRQSAGDDGVYGIVGEFRAKRATERWEQGDSCWGFIGDDATNRFNGYMTDIKAETIRQWRAARKAFILRRRDQLAGRCPCCHGTGKA